MIITGRTINQLPTLSAITSASTLILQTGNTTFKANLSEFAKSPVFGSMYQDLIPVSSNTFSIGSSGSTIKSLYVTSGSVIVGKSGLIGIDSSGNTYSTSGISTPSLFIGNVTSDGIKSTGITINIVSGDTLIGNQSGQSINLFKQIVPTGGTTSQVLAKSSNNDYDFNWLNLQGIYITGATSNGGGLNIYQSATTATLAFKTITSVTSTHITISDTGGLLSISGTGILAITNNGAGAFVAQSGTSSSVALRSLSSQTPSNLSINASGELITFSAKTFITGATNNGSGTQVYQSGDTQTLSFRTLSSSTSDNLTISTSGALVLFSGKTFITGATNNGSGTQLYQSATTSTLAFRTLSSQTPNNLSINSSGELVLFSGKTFITGATNFNNGGVGIFKSADTQTLSFRTLSSASNNLLIIGDGDGLITFTPRQKFSAAFSSMKTQNASVANTIYIMSAETTEHSNGISVLDNTKFKITSSGTYNIQFSTQLQKTGSGNCEVDVWFRKNGNDIPRSNSQIFMAKNSNDKLIASWNYLDVFTSNTDYFEIAWVSTSNDVRILAVTGLTSPTRPDVPSLIVTMFEV
jgi:hypothetical protein